MCLNLSGSSKAGKKGVRSESIMWGDSTGLCFSSVSIRRMLRKQRRRRKARWHWQDEEPSKPVGLWAVSVADARMAGIRLCFCFLSDAGIIYSNLLWIFYLPLIVFVSKMQSACKDQLIFMDPHSVQIPLQQWRPFYLPSLFDVRSSLLWWKGHEFLSESYVDLNSILVT